MPGDAEQKDPLPILEPVHNRRSGTVRQVAVHSIRILVFASILLVIRIQHQNRLAEAEAARNAPSISIEQIKAVFPGVSGIGKWQGSGAAEVLDGDQKRLGSLIHTATESRRIIGYVGSTYLLITLDAKDKISGVFILESEDTVEHVDEVRKHEFFLKSWNGLSWEEAAQKSDVDSVSGATLTSIAIIQSIRSRLGSTQPSLKFPEPTQLKEVQNVFENADRFDPESNAGGWYRVVDANSNLVGYFLRSSPHADHIHGYQGPNDFLTFFDTEKKYLKTVLRSSFDNMEPEAFVQYVRDEEYFLVDQFLGLSLKELANYDEFNVEGASGATMTSEGIFRAMQYSSKKILESKGKNETRVESQTWNLSSRDYGTLGVLIAALLMTFSRLKSIRILRISFQAMLLVYLGFLNGDILSQTVVIGWTQNGVPWQHVIGFWVLTLAAISVPIVWKRNIYCQSICPFGAAQALAGRVVKKKSKLPKNLYKILKLIPAALVIFVVCIGVFGWSFNLASLEPFDAFSFWIAGWAAICIAVIGLLFSFFVPMAYCKFGCPTGGLLEYIRRTGRSDRFGRRDLLAVFLLAIALLSFIG